MCKSRLLTFWHPQRNIIHPDWSIHQIVGGSRAHQSQLHFVHSLGWELQQRGRWLHNFHWWSLHTWLQFQFWHKCLFGYHRHKHIGLFCKYINHYCIKSLLDKKNLLSVIFTSAAWTPTSTANACFRLNPTYQAKGGDKDWCYHNFQLVQFVL